MFGFYFWHVSQVLEGRADADTTFHVFLRVVVALIVAEIAVRVVLRLRNPKEARAPRDERERLIELWARGIAYYTLLAATFLSIGSIHISTSPYALAQHVLLSLVVAELTRLGGHLVLFRRDA